MTIREHLKGNKLRARIVTVDPRTRRIEARAADGGVRQIVVYEPGNNFQWPQEDEIWSICRDNLDWTLGSRIPSEQEGLRIEDLNPGEAIAPSITYTAPHTTLARKYVQTIGNGQDLTYIVYHNLATEDVTASTRAIKTVAANTVSYNILDKNSIEVVFSSIPVLESYRVIVTG
jgi:hypothetical protein